MESPMETLEKSIDHTPTPLPPNEVDCTVQLWTVRDGLGFRSLVQFFLYSAEESLLLGGANGHVLVGWSVPLGETSFPTREAVREAYATTPKGVPWTGLWLEPTGTFIDREPEAEALPAGVGLDREFAKRHGLSTCVQSKDNPNVFMEAPVA